VTRGVTVHLVDRARQALDRLLERGLQVLVEPGIFDRRRGARGHDAEQLTLPLVEALAGGERDHADPAEQALAHLERHDREAYDLARGVRLEQLARACPVLDHEPRPSQALRDRMTVELTELFVVADLVRVARGSLEKRAFTVVEPGRDQVGPDLAQRAVRDGGDHLVERQAGRDGLADLVERQRLAESQVFRGEPALLEAALHDVHDLFDLEGLENVVVRAALHGVDGGLDRAESRHDHRQRVGMSLGHFLEQIEAAHLRHLEVADDHVVARALKLVDGAGPVLGRADDVALHSEKVRDDVADELLVVDDEDARAFLRIAGIELGHP
jgi:hypothetical protein